MNIKTKLINFLNNVFEKSVCCTPENTFSPSVLVMESRMEGGGRPSLGESEENL
jgi:hypothetical protein